MAKLMEMPKLSPTMEEGQIVAWHKKEGDAVEVDDLLAEVETDKATMEFRAFDKGALLKIIAGPGAVVKLGQPVAILGDKGENIDELVAKAGSAPSARAPAAPAQAQEPQPQPEERRAQVEQPTRPEQPAQADKAPARPTADGGRVKASPFVRKVAREQGIDLRAVDGSGPGGRIIARDLEGARPAAPGARPAPAAASAEPIIKPLSMMRKAIARRLTESKQQVPHFYLTIDVDAAPLFDVRTRLNADLGRKISFNDLVIKAAAIAIGRAPEVNASFRPDALVYHRRVDISVAVAIEDGLVTPVVRNADQKSVVQISDQVAALAARAKQKKLTLEEMQGGTFSISNLGMYGIDEFAAVINPPEGAILAVGAIRDEPVARDGEVVAGKRMKLTLSCDHRVVDGAVGAKFLAEIRGVLQKPMQILAL